MKTVLCVSVCAVRWKGRWRSVRGWGGRAPTLPRGPRSGAADAQSTLEGGHLHHGARAGHCCLDLDDVPCVLAVMHRGCWRWSTVCVGVDALFLPPAVHGKEAHRGVSAAVADGDQRNGDWCPPALPSPLLPGSTAHDPHAQHHPSAPHPGRPHHHTGPYAVFIGTVLHAEYGIRGSYGMPPLCS